MLRDYGIFNSYIEITSTDDDQVGSVQRDYRIDDLVGINAFGCQYPGVKIEGPWLDGEEKTVILPKSKKLILSASEDVICETSPGYEFNWIAKMVSFETSLNPAGNTTLEEYFYEREDYSYVVDGSGENPFEERILAKKLEAAIQPRELAEGLWKVTLSLKLVELDIEVRLFKLFSLIFFEIIPSF